MRITSYRNAVRYIESLISDPEKKRQGSLRLERILHILRLVGSPHRSFRSVHVGGTSGKGSTAYIAAAILREAGYKTGLHISPHLEKMNERMQINGKPISDVEFVKLTRWIKPFLEQVAWEGSFGKPSYFETLVALSFEYFRRNRVDIAVIEVGLGGALDATNVISPEVAVITNVNLDHTDILGKTVERIARDKAGIIKERIEVITAAKQESVRGIIKRRCFKDNASLTIIGKDVKYKVLKSSLNGLALKIKTPSATYKIKTVNLFGSHQAGNIACAVAAAERLEIKSGESRIKEKIIRRALSKITVPGRLELFYAQISGRPLSFSKLPATNCQLLTILDGAHNPAKTRALVSALKELFPNRQITFIFAVKKNKDAAQMLRILSPIADKFYFTKFQAAADFGKNQSASPKLLAATLKKIKPGLPLEIIKTSQEALHEAVRYSLSIYKPQTTNCSLLPPANFPIICITGSLYLVGEARKEIFSENPSQNPLAYGAP